MLAGLVAITAPCAFVSAWAAAVIGAVAGVLVIVAAVFERRDRGPGGPAPGDRDPVPPADLRIGGRHRLLPAG